MSLSKDEDTSSGLFSILLGEFGSQRRRRLSPDERLLTRILTQMKQLTATLGSWRICGLARYLYTQAGFQFLESFAYVQHETVCCVI
jgi:hypothetical protein